jgi:hypothetical protein
MKTTRTGLLLLTCSLVVSCGGSGAGSEGNTGGALAGGGTSSLGGMTARAGENAGGTVSANGGMNPTGGASSQGGTGSPGGNANRGGGSSQGAGGATSMSIGGANATGGTPSSGGVAAIGGRPASGGTNTAGGSPGTGGTSSSGGVAATGGLAAFGGTNTAGGSSPAGGETNGTGGSPSTGGETNAAGGLPGVGGGSSVCGPDTLNPNPFGCSFAWGLSDPASDLTAFDFLQFMTFWVDWGIGADGTISTCNGCNWLKNLAATNIVPVYYAYIVGYYAHANGIVDGNQCPADNPDCPNLTNSGATFVRDHRSTIVQAYADYAKQSYAVWPTKPLVWLLEGDFVQFTYDSQPNALSMTEVAQLAADITCAIKGNMPNAVVGINQSTWNANDVTDSYWNAMKSVGVRYDLAWTTGVATNNGFFNTGVNASTYNGATATYAYLHQASGKSIFVDDGCGGNTQEDWSPAPAATLNERIASGVMAFNHCAGLEPNYESLIGALKPQLNSTCH